MNGTKAATVNKKPLAVSPTILRCINPCPVGKGSWLAPASSLGCAGKKAPLQGAPSSPLSTQRQSLETYPPGRGQGRMGRWKQSPGSPRYSFIRQGGISGCESGIVECPWEERRSASYVSRLSLEHILTLILALRTRPRP